MSKMIPRRLVLFLYQRTMYVAHFLDAPTVDDVWYAADHPMYFCNWLPRDMWVRRAWRRDVTATEDAYLRVKHAKRRLRA